MSVKINVIAKSDELVYFNISLLQIEVSPFFDEHSCSRLTVKGDTSCGHLKCSR